MSYWATNCATTAYHLADWIHREADISWRTKHTKLPEYLRHCSSRMPKIDLMEAIANTFKHKTLRKKRLEGAASTQVVLHASPGAWPDENGEFLERETDPHPHHY